MKLPAFALLLCLCGSRASEAQERPTLPPEAPRPQPGIIVGTVVDAQYALIAHAGDNGVPLGCKQVLTANNRIIFADSRFLHVTNNLFKSCTVPLTGILVVSPAAVAVNIPREAAFNIGLYPN